MILIVCDLQLMWLCSGLYLVRVPGIHLFIFNATIRAKCFN